MFPSQFKFTFDLSMSCKLLEMNYMLFGKRAWSYCMYCRIALFKSLAERKKKEGISKAIVFNVSSWMAWICFSIVALITWILIPAQF